MQKYSDEIDSSKQLGGNFFKIKFINCGIRVAGFFSDSCFLFTCLAWRRACIPVGWATRVSCSKKIKTRLFTHVTVRLDPSLHG